MAERRDVLGDLPPPLAVQSPHGTYVSGPSVENVNPLPEEEVIFEEAEGRSGDRSEEEAASVDPEASDPNADRDDPEGPVTSSEVSGVAGGGSRKGGKPNKRARYRTGDNSIARFPKVASIVPRLNLCTDPVWLREIFPKELIREIDLPFFTPDVFSFIPPTPDCRAHDSDRGMCIYYRMPSCGFRLPLTPFQVKLLKFLCAPPAQLSPAAWCYITSFERLFTEFEELAGHEPSLPVFFYHFSLTVTSDFFSLKKKTSKKLKLEPIFLSESGKGQALSKVENWNEGWVYICNPEKIPSLVTISPSWRVLSGGGAPAFSEAKSPVDLEIIKRIGALVSRLGPMPLAYNSLKVRARSLKTGELEPSGDRVSAAVPDPEALVITPGAKSRHVVRKISQPGVSASQKRKSDPSSEAVDKPPPEKKKKESRSGAASSLSGEIPLIVSLPVSSSGIAPSSDTAAVLISSGIPVVYASSSEAVSVTTVRSEPISTTTSLPCPEVSTPASSLPPLPPKAPKPLAPGSSVPASLKGKGVVQEGNTEEGKAKSSARGVVLKKGVLKNNPDACTILLPGSTEVLGAAEKPSGFGHFALEAFRALAPPFMKKRVKRHPERVADELSGYMLQAGAAMVYFSDYMHKQKGKSTIPEIDESELVQATLQRDVAEEEVKILKGQLEQMENWKNGALGKLKTARDDLRKNQKELNSMRSSLENLEAEKNALIVKEAISSRALSDSFDRNTGLSVKVNELEASLTTANARGSFFEDRCKELEKELKDAPSAAVTKFLGSAAFKTAAVVSSVGMLRALIYNVLKDLGRVFPFLPEHLGFGPVDVERKENEQQSLPGYVWDMHDDRLLTPDGTVVTEPEKLQTLPLQTLNHFWDRSNWPEDIPLPIDSSDDDA